MSSQDADNPSISFQKSVISGALNSTLLYLYLSGGYLGFYIFTLRIYGSWAQSKNRIVVGALTALFAVSLAQIVTQWRGTSAIFVGPAERLLMFDVAWGDTGDYIMFVINIILVGLSQILADALLIWRCWNILAQRRYSRFALMCLYVTEICLISASIVIGALQLLIIGTPAFGRDYNNIEATSMCVTAATSITATLIISAHIYSSTDLNHHARKRYSHIVEILIQSSVLYSLAILAVAITIILSNANDALFNEAAIEVAQVYIEAVMIFTTAFAPTLMVARITLARNNATQEVSMSTMVPYSHHIAASEDPVCVVGDRAAGVESQTP